MSGRDYFRGDQRAGITPPDLTKTCDYADHIVHARGKKTAFTSVSLELKAIERFGEVSYLLLQDKVKTDGHAIVEHEDLVSRLAVTADSEEKAMRAKAIQALRYARMRKEGLVTWSFDISGIARKDIITWAYGKVQAYFKVH